jgi:hypothetical protein
MTGDPNPTRMRRLGPVTADGYIGTAAGFPFFIDPHVPGTRRHRPWYGMPHGTNRNIDLSGSLIRNRTSR